VVMKTEMRIFNNNKIRGNEEMFWLFYTVFCCMIKMMDGLCLTPI
jgi:hypothetical protein